MEPDIRASYDRLLELFFLGEISEAEYQQLRDLIDNNSDLKEDFDFQIALKESLVKKDQSAFRQKLQNIEKRDYSPVKQNWFIWLSAASVLLVAGYFIYSSFNQALTSSDELYLAYFEPQRNITYPITRSEPEIELDYRAFLAYENADWAQAVVLFDSLRQVSPDPVIDFYTANAYMAQGSFDDAIQLLIDFKASDSPLAERADWYLALAYLQMDDLSEAKMYLQNIIDNETYPKEKALELLRDLEGQ